MKEKPYHINHFIKYFEVSNRKYKKCKRKWNKWKKTSFIKKKTKSKGGWKRFVEIKY